MTLPVSQDQAQAAGFHTGSLCDQERLGSTELAWPWERNPRSSPSTRSLWISFAQNMVQESQSRIFRVRCVSNVSMADLNISLWRYLALRPVLLLSLFYGLLRYSLASSLLM